MERASGGPPRARLPSQLWASRLAGPLLLAVLLLRAAPLALAASGKEPSLDYYDELVAQPSKLARTIEKKGMVRETSVALSELPSSVTPVRPRGAHHMHRQAAASPTHPVTAYVTLAVTHAGRCPTSAGTTNCSPLSPSTNGS
jgi:hypothetical protein